MGLSLGPSLGYGSPAVAPTLGGGGAAVTAPALLLETSDALLLESGDRLLME